VGEVELREIATFAEIGACVELQKRTWGMPDIDVTPSRLFVIARHTGTPPVGAFDARGNLVGFVHTIRAHFEGTSAFYSHMLAVEEGWRDKGVGRALKLAQRARALEQGVELIVWTFDPLQSRNAHFNLNKLGAVVRRYVPNFYGEEHSSVFDAGIGSDRVFAEWWVRSSKVEEALRGERFRPPGRFSEVEIPANIDDVKRSDREAALLARLRTREQFQSRLSRGMAAVALDHVRGAETSRYVFVDAREVPGAR
jgi:predicted GNAT superfamily acetyltransferase